MDHQVEEPVDKCQRYLEQGFLNFTVPTKYLGVLFRCKFWLSSSGVELKILQFLHVSRGGPGCWSGTPFWRARILANGEYSWELEHSGKAHRQEGLGPEGRVNRARQEGAFQVESEPEQRQGAESSSQVWRTTGTGSRYTATENSHQQWD